MKAALLCVTVGLIAAVAGGVMYLITRSSLAGLAVPAGFVLFVYGLATLERVKERRQIGREIPVLTDVVKPGSSICTQEHGPCQDCSLPSAGDQSDNYHWPDHWKHK